MGRFESAVAATLVMFFQLTSPVSFGRAAPLVLAQADKPAAPDATPSPSQAAATPGSPTSAPAKKTALSTPACSLRFLEAKVAGKPLSAPAENSVAVPQLLEALQQSVAAAKANPKAGQDRNPKPRNRRRATG